MRVNYVVAAWTGARSYEEPYQVLDRTFFIREQLEALIRCTNNLTAITVVLAGPGDPLADQWIRGLHNNRINDIPIIVLERPNFGLSYSSWNHAFECMKNDFDAWILTEDDYVPCLPEFDRALVSEERKVNGYVCGLSNSKHTLASVSLAIMSTATWNRLHPLPENPGKFESQFFWSEAIRNRGVPVLDWTATYSTPFWAGTEVRWYGHPSLPPIFLPVQVINQEARITDGITRILGTISATGLVVPSTEEAEQIWKTWQESPLDSACWRLSLEW